ncbi:MAG: ABC transporter permease [Hyphomicrobiaceae bacterium]|nr:ABC transporter permease [Hyphomicrobiaceae bacterium]
MLRYLASRILYTFAILAAVSFLVFAVTELLPGNVATMILGTDATPEEVANLERLLGLDRPSWERYATWVSGVATGDFGDSLRMQRPIAPILASRLANSLLLTGVALIFVILGGLVLGTVTALNHGTRLDRTFSAVAVIGTSLPEFVTGTVLVLLFGGGLMRILPPSGYEGFSHGIWDGISHLILPALTLATIMAAYVGRIMRTTVIDVLKSEYVRAARLKGLPEWRVILRHVLPNALVPAVTVLCMNLGWMFGGIVVVEEIFVFPGIGRMMLFGIAERDWPVIQACAMVIAAAYVLGNLIGDVLALLLDPRLREAAT